MRSHRIWNCSYSRTTRIINSRKLSARLVKSPVHLSRNASLHYWGKALRGNSLNGSTVRWWKSIRVTENRRSFPLSSASIFLCRCEQVSSLSVKEVKLKVENHWTCKCIIITSVPGRSLHMHLDTAEDKSILCSCWPSAGSDIHARVETRPPLPRTSEHAQHRRRLCLRQLLFGSSSFESRAFHRRSDKALAHGYRHHQNLGTWVRTKIGVLKFFNIPGWRVLKGFCEEQLLPNQNNMAG